MLRLTLDLETRRQVMLGFGASDCWSGQHVGNWPNEQREAIADLLFGKGLDEHGAPRGIGLSVWRFNLGAGSSRDESISRPWRRTDSFFNDDFSGYDWSKLSGQRWLLRAARDRGVDRFIAFVNSPPVNMTANGRAFCGDDTLSTNLAVGKEKDFATYLADVVEHFREVEEIEFDVISPFNEPQWEWTKRTQEGCRYSTDDMQRVIDALAREPGLGATEIEIPESGSIKDLWMGRRYLEAFFGPGSPTNVRGRVADRIVAHSYRTDRPGRGLVQRRRELRRAMDRYPGIDYAMTEYCPLGKDGPERDLGMDTALFVARVIHFDLVLAQAVSWQWWLAVSPYHYKDGLLYIDHRKGGGEVTESKLLWVMGNFSRFVRPGMVRIQVERSDRASHEETVHGLMVSGFLDVESGMVAAVLVNVSDEEISVVADIVGGRVETWSSYLTSADSDLKPQPAIEPEKTFFVPARSVLTVVARTS
ncbi:MAG: glycoside hydrolase [Thermoanaerobaculales bacterium]|nr:glycoside hydrolase [Thermoanaerobaculales bacterium]